MRHITSAEMKRPAMFAVVARHVTHVPQHHITGSFGERSSNVTRELGEFAPPLRGERNITFGQPQGRIEPAARRAEPVDLDVSRPPLGLERTLLVLAHEAEPQATTVAERDPRIRHAARVGEPTTICAVLQTVSGSPPRSAIGPAQSRSDPTGPAAKGSRKGQTA